MSTPAIDTDSRGDSRQVASGRDTTPTYLAPYRDAVVAHGPGFESLLWFNRDVQQRRFEVFGSVAALADRTVADLGCGHADFVLWMHEHGIEYDEYVGVEAIAELADYSRKQIDNNAVPRALCLRADFVADADFFANLVADYGVDTLVMSGSLNTLTEDRAKAVLDRAWQAISRQAGGQLVFNFLCQIEGQPARDTFLPVPRFGAKSMFAWALERTPLVVYCQYYLGGHDATIAMMAPR